MRKIFNILFLSMILIAMVYALFLDTNLGITGYAVKEGGNIYDYLRLVKNQPDAYRVVTGKYARPYEKKHAEKIAASLGIKSYSEQYIVSPRRILLFGTPGTNLMLSDHMDGRYKRGTAMIMLNKNNLIMVAGDEKQAARISGLITEFEKNKDELQLSSKKIGLDNMLAALVLISVLATVALIIILEKNRKSSIDKLNYRKKINDLKGYISGCKKEGYNDQQIKAWLEKNSYSEELINKAMSEAENA
ncbi:hypothetical protein GF323_03680 [Candidatus Woesearchaeota archaeon]|nr:hypothetical protein [Candidatus Woesearchaeota archaeon]